MFHEPSHVPDDARKPKPPLALALGNPRQFRLFGSGRRLLLELGQFPEHRFNQELLNRLPPEFEAFRTMCEAVGLRPDAEDDAEAQARFWIDAWVMPDAWHGALWFAVAEAVKRYRWVAEALDYRTRKKNATIQRQADEITELKARVVPYLDGASLRPEVQRRLLALVDQGEPYTSLRELADRPIFACAPNTIRNAIDESSLLVQWRRVTATRRKPRRAQSVHNPVVQDNAVQDREPGPVDEAAERQVQSTLDRLKSESDEEDRARLERLDPQKQRQLAKIVLAQRSDDRDSGRPDADADDVVRRRV